VEPKGKREFRGSPEQLEAIQELGSKAIFDARDTGKRLATSAWSSQVKDGRDRNRRRVLEGLKK